MLSYWINSVVLALVWYSYSFMLYTSSYSVKFTQQNHVLYFDIKLKCIRNPKNVCPQESSFFCFQLAIKSPMRSSRFGTANFLWYSICNRQKHLVQMFVLLSASWLSRWSSAGQETSALLRGVCLGPDHWGHSCNKVVVTTLRSKRHWMFHEVFSPLWSL